MLVSTPMRRSPAQVLGGALVVVAIGDVVDVEGEADPVAAARIAGLVEKGLGLGRVEVVGDAARVVEGRQGRGYGVTAGSAKPNQTTRAMASRSIAWARAWRTRTSSR
jgi:hypothetical protein